MIWPRVEGFGEGFGGVADDDGQWWPVVLWEAEQVVGELAGVVGVVEPAGELSEPEGGEWTGPVVPPRSWRVPLSCFSVEGSALVVDG